MTIEFSASSNPVLCLNPHAPLADIYAYADRRIRLARNLARSLSGMTPASTEDGDVHAISETFSILLEDGCNALEVIERRLVELQ
ncbi:hypothetical protein [Pseudomonas akapageensis]|uniref:hypothetical protein n=1 Tax=Pseudomonas akapageensis TaxID=2609961 RepID=UPI0014098611|nr:hypothetical protein [Pseudomonas akapageensis]